MDVLRRWTVGQIGQDTYSKEDRDNFKMETEFQNVLLHSVHMQEATDKLRYNSKRDTSSSLPGKMCRK